MIEIVGWIGTLLVLMGYIANSRKSHTIAMITWIFGDIIWILYDIWIENWSHMTLSFIIIAINLYGIYNIINTWTIGNEHTEK